MTTDVAVAIIAEAASECNPVLAAAMAEKGAEVLLFGPDGVLDSIGLVTLVSAVEMAVEERFDCCIMLADERAMSRTRSPFRNVRRLAEYLVELVNEEQGQ